MTNTFKGGTVERHLPHVQELIDAELSALRAERDTLAAELAALKQQCSGHRAQLIQFLDRAQRVVDLARGKT